MMALLWKAWDRFLLYLPVAIMGLLALGSYWLVRSTPMATPAPPPPAAKHAPDYFMDGFSVRTFAADGRIRLEMRGDAARHYPDTQHLEVDNIRLRSFDAQGHVTTAHARRGLSNEDGSEVQLLGDAVLVREAQTNGTPRTEFRSEFLHIFSKTEQVRSHKPVQLLRGNDLLRADSLDFDNVEQRLQLRGQVRASLQPQQAQP